MSTQPQTLMQMAGAQPSLPVLDECALLFIDFQCQYLSGATQLHGVTAALDVAGKLLATCRNADVPVVHVCHQGRPGGMFDPETNAFEIAPQVKANSGEKIVTKLLPNAFAGTDLQQVLKDTGREKLIVTGFMTHMCVSSTVRAALDLGWNSFVVGDACATRDLPNPLVENGVILAETIHSASLAGLADRFATIVSCDQVG